MGDKHRSRTGTDRIDDGQAMTDETLQTYVEEISETVFGRNFKHRAVFNPRLKTTGGRYFLDDHHLDFNRLFLSDMRTFRGIVIHELCHYHLHLLGKGHRHGDADFKEWLQRYGGLRYCPRLEGTIKSKKIHLYECSECWTLYRRKRRMDPDRYRCGKCKGKIFYKSS